MKAVVIMYDSLNKKYLNPYGDQGIDTPNFLRLSESTLTFDNFHVGSLPCMPARREMHTGRYNFLHRGWSPLEPFDESMPQMLRENGIYTHLVTDHCHYWEDGGSTYHNRFVSYEFVRGHEGDRWKGVVEGFDGVDTKLQDQNNRMAMKDEKDHYHARACQEGIGFIRTNKDQDNWYLQLEYFDPHEPFFVPDKYKKMVKEQQVEHDWPKYRPVSELANKELEDNIISYKALLLMCDVYLGKILDVFDELDLWKDTMLIVNTDHGFMLGEHGYVGKNYMPVYNEIANTPFFIWDPRKNMKNERRQALCQTIDIAPTVLEFFGMEKGKHMLGASLAPVIENDETIHDAVLFGYHGMHINVTDGRYTYMRAAKTEDNGPLYQYTLMPNHIMKPFSIPELKQADRELYDGFEFTENVPLLRIPVDERYDKRKYYKYSDHKKYGSFLFDNQIDDEQMEAIKNTDIENTMISHMIRLMKENESPEEQFERLGLNNRVSK